MPYDPVATLDLSLFSLSRFLSLLRYQSGFQRYFPLGTHLQRPVCFHHPSPPCNAVVVVVVAAFSREINLALLKWSLLDLSYDLETRHSRSNFRWREISRLFSLSFCVEKYTIRMQLCALLYYMSYEFELCELSFSTSSSESRSLWLLCFVFYLSKLQFLYFK